MKILITIPALNEENTISQVVKNCIKYGDVLVIDDGSTDQTVFSARSAGAKVLKNQSKGYESCLRIGHQYAITSKYDVFVTIDGDGELPASRIPSFIKKIKDGFHCVIGKRKKFKRFTERVISFVCNQLLGLHDPYCGMKAFDIRSGDPKIYSSFNSIGTHLFFKYIFLGRRIANIEINTKIRRDFSRFGGKIVSEFRLLPSCIFGIVIICYIYMKKKIHNSHSIFK